MSNVPLRIPTVGKKYWRREYEGMANMHKVKVIRVFRMTDGSTIVRYRFNWPFPIDEDSSLKDFWKDTEAVR